VTRLTVERSLKQDAVSLLWAEPAGGGSTKGGVVNETVASPMQAFGAAGFGAIIGWYVYFVNRYRTAEVQLTDLVTLVGVIGGGAVTALFSPKTDLFGAYGIGLVIGFFGYFLTLVVLVSISSNFDADWFLDGRRKRLGDDYEIPQGTATTVRALDAPDQPGGGPRVNT
jgi:hypothetical protein